jgi:hypothetical protein
MAYPNVSAPYGLKPVNLIGGQVFAGSTREYPIIYGYATSVYTGDLVQLSRGNLQRAAITTTMGSANVVGVFLGCSYTDPVTKQKRFSQYWPASTLAGDAVAVVSDDPDAIFKAAAVATGSATIISANTALVGQNAAIADNAGNVNTGNSAIALVSPAATAATTSTLPLRVMGLVKETAISLGTGVFTSIATATITPAATLPFAIPVGTEVGSIAANGQYIHSGSFVATAYVAGAATIVLNQAPLTAFVASSTLVFTQYPEVYVKINALSHGYYSATGIA